jgi:hypothetical protein
VTVFSPRFALPLAILLGIAAVSVFALARAPRQDECASPQALLDPNSFTPPLELIEEGFRASRLDRGRLTAVWTSPGGRQYPVAIVRSYGMPNVLLQPPIALPGRNEADDVHLGTLETATGPVPVHYAYERRGREVRLTAYLLAHRRMGLASPLWTRISEGPSALVGGTWPITVFAAATRGHVSAIDRGREDLEQWLTLAWNHYQQVCGAQATAEGASDPRVGP